MNIRDSFFILDLKMKIEKKLEVYNPNLKAHLSNQLYDEYLIKSRIYNEILELMDTIDITRESIVEFLQKKIELSNELIKNTKIETEFENTVDEISDITGENNTPDADRIPYGKSIGDVWKIDYDAIDEDEDAEKVEDLMILLQDYYNDYKEVEEERGDIETVLEKAKENLEEADEWLTEIEGYNYD